MINDVRLRSIERARGNAQRRLDRVLEKCGFGLEREESVEDTDGDVAELMFVLR